MEANSGAALDDGDGATGEELMATESEGVGTENKDEKEKQAVSSRPAKRTRRAPAKKRTAKKAASSDADEKPAKKATRKKVVKVSEKKVVSSRPRQRATRKSAVEEDEKKTVASVVEAPEASSEAPEAPREEPTKSAPEEQESAPRWGRSQRRQAPPRIVTAETAAELVLESTSRVPAAAPATTEPDTAPAPEPQKTEAVTETQTAATTGSGDEDSQTGSEGGRGRGRGRTRRRRPGSRSTTRQDAPTPTPSAEEPQTAMGILEETWSEDRARKIMSEGFLVSLAAPLKSSEEIPGLDADVLADRLRVVRRVLADECMVEDDVTDVMMLDMVMNALADRIEVYRLTADGTGAEHLERILELRYKADRRLIETVTALKNT
jgi:hypothetical protein